MTADRHIASARHLTVAAALLAALGWAMFLVQGARLSSMQDLRDEVVSLWVAQREASVLRKIVPHGENVTAPYGDIHVYTQPTYVSVDSGRQLQIMRQLQPLSQQILPRDMQVADPEGPREVWWTYALAPQADQSTPWLGASYYPVREPEAHLEAVRRRAEALGIELSGSRDAGELARQIRRSETLSIKLPIPGVDTSQLVRIPFAAAMILTTFFSVSVIIALGSRLRIAVRADDRGAEPWLILDASSPFERLFAGAWALAILASPFLSGFVGVYGAIAAFHRSDLPDAGGGLPPVAAIVPLAALALGVIGGWRSIETLQCLLALRDRRQSLGGPAPSRRSSERTIVLARTTVFVASRWALNRKVVRRRVQ